MTTNLSWIDRYFQSAFTLNDDGVAVFSATEATTSGDPLVTISDKYTGATSSDDTPLDITLPWTVADSEVWAIEVYVTAKSADAAVRRLVKVTALVYGVGATATLDAAATVVPLGTGNATADLQVTGATMVLHLDPVDATPLTWGYEVRGQKL